MVYVDELNWTSWTRQRGKKKFCHLFADTVEELHRFATKLGRKRCWFHRSRSGICHYDLDESFRAMAIDAGAKVINTSDYLRILRSAT